MRKILQSYLRRLTNLSGNNRSLLLMRLISDQFVDLHHFDFLNNKPSFSIIEELIERKNKISLCEVVDVRTALVNKLSHQLKKLQRIEKFIFEERGAKDLYVGWPFVRGMFADGTPVRCPLIFFPVELVEENNQWKLSLREDVSLSLNKSFLLAYAFYNQIKLDEGFLEYDLDGLDKDSVVFRTALYQLFKDGPVVVNFNQENFIDKLASFENYKKADFNAAQKVGKLKLFPEAVLGIFPQAGSYLVPDYISMMDNDKLEDITDFFMERSTSDETAQENAPPDTYRYLSKVKEEQTFTPFSMDAFQENALKAVKNGNSLVIQGPPGTGKSQLICNLIADYMARGRRVLLVCQKRAALDVVYKRLSEVEAADFVALVHDFKNDRKIIYQQIDKQINKIIEYSHKNNSLDAIHIERQFLQTSRRIDQLTEELEEFRHALFDEKECGVSVKELYLTSDIDGSTINIKQEYRHFTFPEVGAFVKKLKRNAFYAHKLMGKDFPWKERKNFAKYGLDELRIMQEIIHDVPVYQKEIVAKVALVLHTNIDLNIAAAVASKEEDMLKMLTLLDVEPAFQYFQHVMDHPEKEMEPLWLLNMERVIMGCYNGEGPELSLASDDLGSFQEVLQKRMDLRQNVFKYLKWIFLSGEKYFLKRVLAANGLPNNRKGFNTLVEKIDNRLNLEHNLTKLKEQPWLVDLPESYRKIDLQNWFYYQKKALDARIIVGTVRNFKEYFNVKSLTYTDFKQCVITLLDIVKVVPEKMAFWQAYLMPAQLHVLLHQEEEALQLQKTLQRDFDAMCEFDLLKEQLAPEEAIVIERLYDAVEDNFDDTLPLFQNSLRLAWIGHIETKYPVLRAVTSQKLQMMEEEMQQCVEEKLTISKEIFLLKARERTYQDVEYNRLKHRVTYRDLQHQVSKKRNIWPIRKLLGTFGEELFNLVPCWLASPESVSALFEMEPIFDLVIFDEASQCFAEKGIPAMFRGKQVVITGDDKQLSPFDLYRVRWEDEAEDQPAQEVDSLLDLARQYLMQVQLRSHYRSRSLDLIDFSNQHFYEGKLKLLPAFADLNNDNPAIKYIKVDGLWENQINQVEGEKVVALVEELLAACPEKEIGIVTFNATQQGFIMDLLEKTALERQFTIPASLFVKNIENVQGDEKDIIIFSIAYAPDKNGKMSMQFGSLNLEKGENRLNVAVTRAKDSIYVVSSIYPQQLKVTDSKHEGPGLLRKYLAYALNVSEGKYTPTLPEPGAFNPEWFLKKKIMQCDTSFSGVEISQQVPFADLSVTSNSRVTGLIVTDDDLYHQSVSVKEPHVYLPFAFKEKNWKYKMFYSREYWHDKLAVQEKVLKFINQAENNA